MKTPLFVSLVLASILGMVGAVTGASIAHANGCISPAAGTTEDPFLIQNESNLECLHSNSDYYWTHGYHFKQTANLDMANYASWQSGIGTQAKPFDGVFDGAGFNILGLSFTGNTSAQGLFGMTDPGSHINDTHVLGATMSISGADDFQFAGLLVGLSLGSISHSSATGTITILASSSAASIGGLVGGSQLGTISHSSADVSINLPGTSDVSEVGGLIGTAYNTSIFEVQSAGSIVTSGVHAGVSDLGGIVGNLEEASLRNAWSSSRIESQGSYIARYFGSIVGKSSTASISNVYTVGTVSISSTNGGEIKGAMIGRVANDTELSNSFWNTDSLGSQITAVGFIEFGLLTQVSSQGVTSTELRKYTTFGTTQFLTTPWSIANGTVVAPSTVWGICNTSSFPFLTALSSSSMCPSPEPVVPQLAETGFRQGELVRGSTLLVLVGALLVYSSRRVEVPRN